MFVNKEVSNLRTERCSSKHDGKWKPRDEEWEHHHPNHHCQPERDQGFMKIVSWYSPSLKSLLFLELFPGNLVDFLALSKIHWVVVRRCRGDMCGVVTGNIVLNICYGYYWGQSVLMLGDCQVVGVLRIIILNYSRGPGCGRLNLLFDSFDLSLSLGSHHDSNGNIEYYEDCEGYDECQEGSIDTVSLGQVIIWWSAGGVVGSCRQIFRSSPLKSSSLLVLRWWTMKFQLLKPG